MRHRNDCGRLTKSRGDPQIHVMRGSATEFFSILDLKNVNEDVANREALIVLRLNPIFVNVLVR